MTWQIGSFAILALALTGGFVWYEKTRPDARIVALVGVLAAFAALSRIAFAAIPNVKPTTDIVLIAGYALGGAPGFVVGAIAGLTSNFFFGQGPWTPWQMTAWGAAGALGAGLEILTRGRIGRWPLALVCFLVGYAFAAFQDVGDWVTYSDHSLAQLGVFVGKGTGFDVIHAVGCFGFALAFGPALTRSIARFAARMQVLWGSVDGAVLPSLAVLTVLALATASPARAASDPTGYLLAAQNSDGGLGSAPGQPSTALFSGWAALGLASAGQSPSDVRHGGASLVDYIRSAPGSDVGSVERTILALRAAGLPAGSLIASLQRDIRADGSVSSQVNLTSFAVLALRSAGIEPTHATLTWLASQQNSDGGFSFASAGGGSDIDDTGAALEALGGSSPRAVAFLRHQQNQDGGFPAQPGGESNAQSTAWAVQGLLAAGAGLGSLAHGSPLQFLRSLIDADGHVQYSHSSDQTPVWVTAQALMALQQQPLPLVPAPSGHRAAGSHRARGSGARSRGKGPGGARRRATVRSRRRASALLLSDAAGAGLVMALALAPVGE